MPPQKTRRQSSSQKGPVDGYPIRELEFTMSSKRSLSCTECRRLKRRCNRQWPCQSCIARGCASICPDGALVALPGSGTKYVLHGSEKLHKKILEMSERIKQLEDALSGVTATSGEHPLLRRELLKIKLPPDTQNAEEELDVKDGMEEELDDIALAADELGTLTLGAEGKMNYMGRTAKLEYILSPEDPPSPNSTGHDSFTSYPRHNQSSFALHSLPDSIVRIAQSFLLSVPPSCPIDVLTLKLHLPTLDRALYLCNTFFENGGWFYRPMEKVDFMTEIFSPVYGLSSPMPVSEEDTSSSPLLHGAHDLALFFMVLSCGAAVDLAQSPENEETEVYLTLAKAAVCIESPWDSSSVVLLLTLHLMTYYSIIWEQRNVGLEYTWELMGLVSRVALSLGLHRDPARWQLNERECNVRRRAFWEAFNLECWQTLGFGRPPSIHITYFDCEMPTDTGELQDAQGKVIARSYEGIKYRFVRDAIWPIADHSFNVKSSTTYASALELDRKVREIEEVELANKPPHISPFGIKMQAYLTHCMKEYALLYVHRSYFRRALTLNPNSPLETPFSSSVLTTFKSAVSLIQHTQPIYEEYPGIVSRLWLTFTYMLKTAIPLGLLCIYGPRGTMAPHAYAQLNAVVNLAQSAQSHSPRVGHILPTLIRMQHRAYQAIVAISNHPSTGLSSTGSISQENIKIKEEDPWDELDAYGGASRVIRLPAASSSSPDSSQPGSRQSPTFNPPDDSFQPIYPPKGEFQDPAQTMATISRTLRGRESSFSRIAPSNSAPMYPVPPPPFDQVNMIPEPPSNQYYYTQPASFPPDSNNYAAATATDMYGFQVEDLTWLEHFGTPRTSNQPRS